MLAILEDFAAVDLAVDTFVNTFAIIGESVRDPLERRLEAFSAIELMAVRHFLEFVMEAYGDFLFNRSVSKAIANIDRRLGLLTAAVAPS
jgi:uncharacterized protein (DUF2164 family)